MLFSANMIQFLASRLAKLPGHDGKVFYAALELCVHEKPIRANGVRCLGVGVMDKKSHPRALCV